MEITISEFADAARRITLVARLDLLGAEKIDLPLAAAAGARGILVIDMMGVDYIASIGIRHLVMAAKTVVRGSGRLVLLNPTPMVTEVLRIADFGELLPIVRSEARHALFAPRLTEHFRRRCHTMATPRSSFFARHSENNHVPIPQRSP